MFYLSIIQRLQRTYASSTNCKRNNMTLWDQKY